MKRRVFILAVLVGLMVPSSSSVAPVQAYHPATVYWLFAHPDDETLAAGAAIHEHHDAGLYNVLVILTRGEATRVCPQLNLSTAQCIEARRKESAAAAVDLGFDRVDRFTLPDGGLTEANVRSVIDGYVAQHDPDEDIRFKGHSPNDHYGSYGFGGHPDHEAVGRALKYKYDTGVIDDLRMYCIGHLFDSPYDCEWVVTPPNTYQAAKRLAIDEYMYENTSIGRYAIGYKSVPGAFNDAYPYGSEEQIDRP